MSIGMIIFLSLILIIALVGTFVVFREEENKMKKHKADGDTAKIYAERSEEYEENWLKTGLRKQIVIYAVTIIVFIVIALIIFN
ncbi:MAG TPA: hypothetical protein VK121_01920 [Pseudogracilibacillus sp.]|nr:hypothetical protein [Pseudogracilibacillus sp.]